MVDFGTADLTTDDAALLAADKMLCVTTNTSGRGQTDPYDSIRKAFLEFRENPSNFTDLRDPADDCDCPPDDHDCMDPDVIIGTSLVAAKDEASAGLLADGGYGGQLLLSREIGIVTLDGVEWPAFMVVVDWGYG